MPHPSREIHLARRPRGEPTADDLRLVETEVADPGPGEVLVRTTWMSVDPAMRGWMDEGDTCAPAYEVDRVLWGSATGVVEAVGDGVEELSKGDAVATQLGWRDRAVLPAGEARKLDLSGGTQPQTYLGVLGVPGLTAYVGLLDVAALREGDVVYVSGAAGAVGSLAGQLAHHRGNRVIGSAGTPEKVAWLTDELGFDSAFDYKAAPTRRQLREHAPDGIDVFFDNVGGEQLEAALGALNDHGRVAACGAISTYNATEPPPGPRNLGLIVQKRLRVEGFIVIDHFDRMRAFLAEIGPLVADGTIKHAETVVEGLEHAPEALIGLFSGRNTGKMLVQVPA